VSEHAGIESSVSACSTKHGNRSDEGFGLLGLVPPGGSDGLHVAVVTSESVDAGLGVNETELGVLVLSELLEMLSDCDGLLNQVVEVFGNGGSHASLLEDSENLAASDTLDLGNAVAVTKSDTDLRRLCALLGQLNDLINEVVGGNLHPAWWRLSVREASASDTLAGGVHSSHFV